MWHLGAGKAEGRGGQVINGEEPPGWHVPPFCGQCFSLILSPFHIRLPALC